MAKLSSDPLFLTGDGSHSVRSQQFGVSYHSRHGAITEAYHVFINAALRFKAVIQKQVNILEIGFGTGLNAYVTLLEGTKRNLEINYTAIEAFPISLEQANALNYPEQLEPNTENQFIKLHQTDWAVKTPITDNFMLEKLQMKFEDLDFENQFDIIYFDAFAPDAQPELWNEPMLECMFRCLKPEGIMTTYCAKGVVKRTMKKVGFLVEALPGPPGKREMTRASKII